MKKTFTFLFALTMALVATAQTTKNEMRVYFGHGGRYMTFDIANLDSIKFKKYLVHEENPNFTGKLFTVGEDTTVIFSQGNLQYQASTGLWRFADNQYDIIGEDNVNISDKYDGWIDLFGWGTGSNPTNISNDNYDYSTFVDWGTNDIITGGYDANTWRTLTKYEYVYLFCKRANAEQLFGLGNVNGVNGVIILPDNWKLPAGLTFKSSKDIGLKWTNSSFYYSSASSSFYSTNTYSASEWAKMEYEGAVFLPAAGRRYDSCATGCGRMATINVGTGGFYWAFSSTTGANYAPNLYFDSRHVQPYDAKDKCDGFSVRLVRWVR